MTAPPPGPGWPTPVAAARPEQPRLAAFGPVAGTPFGVAIVAAPTELTGLALGSLAAGTGSVLVSFVAGCFGTLGARGGWGAGVAGAFAILAGLAGVAAISLGSGALAKIRKAPGRLTGRGVAITGVALGIGGLALTAVAFVLALAL